MPVQRVNDQLRLSKLERHHATLHYATLHYATLHHIHCATLHYATLHHATLHYATLHCATLTIYTVLRCTVSYNIYYIMTETYYDKLDAFQIKALRKMLGIAHPCYSKISNTKVLETANEGDRFPRGGELKLMSDNAKDRQVKYLVA